MVRLLRLHRGMSRKMTQSESRNTRAIFPGSNGVGSMATVKKIMSIIFYRPLPFLIMGFVLVLGAIPEAISPVRAQAGIAPGTKSYIEQRSTLEWLVTHKQPALQDLIKTVIAEEKVIKEARKQGVSPTDAEIDGAFAAMCSQMGLTNEQLTKSLAELGIRANVLRQRIEADIARSNLRRILYGRRLAS